MRIWPEPHFCQHLREYFCKIHEVSQSSFDDQLGRSLADLRRGLSISQEYLAEILRRDQTFVSKVETGKRALSVQEFVRWTKALNLSSEDVLNLMNQLDSHD